MRSKIKEVGLKDNWARFTYKRFKMRKSYYDDGIKTSAINGKQSRGGSYARLSSDYKCESLRLKGIETYD